MKSWHSSTPCWVDLGLPWYACSAQSVAGYTSTYYVLPEFASFGRSITHNKVFGWMVAVDSLCWPDRGQFANLSLYLVQRWVLLLVFLTSSAGKP
ncbi:hypothetical protein DSO57_1030012 [Entomophthora muscae]|uniref:Uncharacterized protein n=1 Tax=Entomophthora muscae TaxID=34485 RepID=A0ACC2TNB9_9FUNG|nr:hypothetical protein DSO57_1030012 [Entomophthora muscae]